ncbi:MAG: hypothetical protein CMN03_02095 [Roseibacillus sp.]|nr:hypothetical protein [Roseibacillus sp.]
MSADSRQNHRCEVPITFLFSDFQLVMVIAEIATHPTKALGNCSATNFSCMWRNYAFFQQLCRRPLIVTKSIQEGQGRISWFARTDEPGTKSRNKPNNDEQSPDQHALLHNS